MSLRRKSIGRPKAKGFKSSAHWPTTKDIHAYVWSHGPTPEDAAWAAINMNLDDDGHSTDNPPDEYYDTLAEEAALRDRIERGLSL